MGGVEGGGGFLERVCQSCPQNSVTHLPQLYIYIYDTMIVALVLAATGLACRQLRLVSSCVLGSLNKKKSTHLQLRVTQFGSIYFEKNMSLASGQLEKLLAFHHFKGTDPLYSPKKAAPLIKLIFFPCLLNVVLHIHHSTNFLGRMKLIYVHLWPICISSGCMTNYLPYKITSSTWILVIFSYFHRY